MTDRECQQPEEMKREGSRDSKPQDEGLYRPFWAHDCRAQDLCHKTAWALAELAARHKLLEKVKESPAMFVCIQGSSIQAGLLLNFFSSSPLRSFAVSGCLPCRGRR